MDSYQSYLDDKIEDMRKDIKGHYAPYPADFDGKVTSIESFVTLTLMLHSQTRRIMILGRTQMHSTIFTR